MTSSSASGRLAQLFYYIKEARERWGADHILEGAPLLPCELVAACALLSVC